MTDTTEGERDRNEEELALIAALIDGIIAEICAHHYEGLAQEHQLTSRIAQALDERLRQIRVGNLTLKVDTREFPDKGAGSLEKPTGADLYISVVRQDDLGEGFSKGMLVQSKWDHALSKDRKRFREQAGKMLRRSDSSYIWVYEERGISVVRAEEVGESELDRTDAMTVGELIAGGLKCDEGDPDIGRDTDLPLTQSLNSVMTQLGVDTSLSFQVTTADT